MMQMHEMLESRVLLAASVAGGVLRVDGGGGDDDIVISRSRSSINVSINGTRERFSRRGVRSVRIRAGGGHDTVHVRLPLPATMQGGPGDDDLFGNRGSDSIGGGAGDDSIDGGGGNDSLRGGAGGDTLAGGSGIDLLNGDAGRDRITGGGGTDFSLDGQDPIRDPDSADRNIDVLFGVFPGLPTDIFPGGQPLGGDPVFGGGGGGDPVFGGGGGSIFG
jgi:Ca2+-binding RTX toxin-like protein